MRSLAAVIAVLLVLAAPASAQIHGPHEERVKQVKDLAKQGDLDSTKKIVPFLKDPHPFPRDAAFLALSELKDEKSIAWLCADGLSVSDVDVRADIVEAIGILGAKAAAPGLVKLLDRSDKNRALVAEVLGLVGSTGDSEILLKLAKGGADTRIRAAALEAALRLDPSKAPEAVKLSASIEGNKYELKVATIRALLSVDPFGAGADAAVAAISDRRTSWEKHESRSDVGPWQPAVAAMRGLARLEGREKHGDKISLAIDALIPLLDHEKGRVRHEVHAALIDLSGKADIPDDRAAWAGWWAVKREGFQPAPVAKRAPIPDPWGDGKKKRKKGDDDAASADEPGAGVSGGSTSVRFHGVPVYSDRVEFIIDLSGSMRGAMPVKPDAGKDAEAPIKMDVSKDELGKTIAQLGKEIQFNVIFFGTDVKAWQAALVAASEPAKAEALDFVKKADIMGRTNFWGALEKAAADPQADTIYFLTDGGSTTEGNYIDQRRITRQLLESARYSLVEVDCLLFGSESQQKAGSPSRKWLEALAASTGGHFFIRPE